MKFFLLSATVLESYAVFWVNQHTQEIEVVFLEGSTTEVPPVSITEVPPVSTTESFEYDFYQECGVTKTCFGISNERDCVANRRCDTIGAVIHNEGKFTFEMRASSNFIFIF